MTSYITFDKKGNWILHIKGQRARKMSTICKYELKNPLTIGGEAKKVEISLNPTGPEGFAKVATLKAKCYATVPEEKEGTKKTEQEKKKAEAELKNTVADAKKVEKEKKKYILLMTAHIKKHKDYPAIADFILKDFASDAVVSVKDEAFSDVLAIMGEKDIEGLVDKVISFFFVLPTSEEDSTFLKKMSTLI